jgi:hypothetical protein
MAASASCLFQASKQRCETSGAFIVFSGCLNSVCRPTTCFGISHVASNVRVAGGKENAFGQRSLSDMQIARFVPSKVNEKNAIEADGNRFLFGLALVKAAWVNG